MIDRLARVRALNDLANQCLANASDCSKPADVEHFLRLARDLYADADACVRDLQIESTWLYLDFNSKFKSVPEYRDYCEFCIRNGFQVLSEVDFRRAVEWSESR